MREQQKRKEMGPLPWGAPKQGKKKKRKRLGAASTNYRATDNSGLHSHGQTVLGAAL